MVKLSQVRTYYGREQILKGIDLEVDQGEFLSVVGPSGCGKSTLLNVMAGLLTPAEGSVEIAGVPVYELDLARRTSFRRDTFGFVFQTFNLIPYLTALENVEVPLYVAGMDKGQQRDRALFLLDRVGLAAKAERLPSELSVGEQQRVAIARALVNDPRVVLADEPTGNLDRRTGVAMMDHIAPLARDGITVILVTHDLAMAERAPRKLNIVDGRLVA